MAALLNYYAELGLDRGATTEQLDAELKALRKKWISRQNSASETAKRQKAERMVELIREATEVLLDENKRKKYDKELDKKGSQATATDSEAVYTPASTAGLEGAALLDALEGFYENSQYNQAITAANQLLSSGMVNVDVYRLLILSQLEKGDANGAMRSLSNMTKALPDDPDSLLLAAKVLLRVMVGHEREARPYLDALFEAGYGDNSDVASLDAEYYIDIGDANLAEMKIKNYLANHPNDSSFKSSIADAYIQRASNTCTVEVGGDWYIDSEAQYKEYESLFLKAQAISPNPKVQEHLAAIKKRQLVPNSWISWGMCFLYAIAGFAAESPLAIIVSLLLGVGILYFSLVPEWMVARFEYKGHLCGMYEIVRYIGIVITAWWRIGWKFFRILWDIIFAFM